MKKSVFIHIAFISLALAPSCESVLDLGDDGLGDVLLMNAQMCAGDSTHTVWLSLNSARVISSAPDATISCFVNDRMVCQTRRVAECNEHSFAFSNTVFRASGYKIRAHFTPGDNICIKADYQDHHCEAHVVVPRAPIIRDVMTDETHNFTIRIQDIKNEYSFYSLHISRESCVIVEETGSPWSSLSPGDTTAYEKNDVWIDSRDEPLLNSGTRTIINPELTQESFFDNTDNIFSDSMFRNEEYEIRVSTPKESFLIRPKLYEDGNRQIGYNKATIRIKSFSEEEYVYLTGCEYVRSFEGNSLYSEPFIFPDNVDGGMGFVSVSSYSDYVINFPPRRFDSIEDWIRWGTPL